MGEDVRGSARGGSSVQAQKRCQVAPLGFSLHGATSEREVKEES